MPTLDGINDAYSCSQYIDDEVLSPTPMDILIPTTPSEVWKIIMDN